MSVIEITNLTKYYGKSRGIINWDSIRHIYLVYSHRYE